MDEKTLNRLNECRAILEKNPDDRQATLQSVRLLVDIGQGKLGADLLSNYLKTHAVDPDIASLAKELGIRHADWSPSQQLRAAPQSFREISGFLDTIHGWILKDQERFLFEKVKSLPDGAVILEMGCCKGKSTAAMAFACIGTRKHIYSIDTFEGNGGLMGKIDDLEPAWRENLTRYGLLEYATPLRGFTFAVVPDRSRYPAPDFVFIDASHEFTDVLEDFRGIYPYVKDGGFISFHDVEPGWPGSWRVWKEFGMPTLTDYEYSTTLACGRKVAGKPFQRRPAESLGFSHAWEYYLQLNREMGPEHALVLAMKTSLEGRAGTREEKEKLLEAEKRLAQAPEAAFHATVKDFVCARDGRIEGHSRLWYGLSLMGQGKNQEAAEELAALDAASLPLSPERAEPYLNFVRQQAGLPSQLAANGVRRGSAFRQYVRSTDVVIALGAGNGAVLSGLDCAYRVGIESDRELRKQSISEFGLDALDDWNFLPDACADLILSDGGLERVESPLLELRAAYAKLKPGGRAVFLVGQSSTDSSGKPALYAWDAGALENIFRKAGFTVRSLESSDPGAGGLRLIALKPSATD